MDNDVANPWGDLARMEASLLEETVERSLRGWITPAVVERAQTLAFLDTPQTDEDLAALTYRVLRDADQRRRDAWATLTATYHNEGATSPAFRAALGSWLGHHRVWLELCEVARELRRHPQ